MWFFCRFLQLVQLTGEQHILMYNAKGKCKYSTDSLQWNRQNIKISEWILRNQTLCTEEEWRSHVNPDLRHNNFYTFYFHILKSKPDNLHCWFISGFIHKSTSFSLRAFHALHFSLYLYQCALCWFKYYWLSVPINYCMSCLQNSPG